MKYKTHKKASNMWGRLLFMKVKSFNMDMELKIGVTKLNTREIGNMDYNQDTVSKIGCRQNRLTSEDGVMA